MSSERQLRWESKYVDTSLPLFSTESRPLRHQTSSMWHHTWHTSFHSDAIAERLLEQTSAPSASRSISPQGDDEVGPPSPFPVLCPSAEIEEEDEEDEEEDVILGLKIREMCLKWLSSPTLSTAKNSRQRGSGIPGERGGVLVVKALLSGRSLTSHGRSSSTLMWLQSVIDPALIPNAAVALSDRSTSVSAGIMDGQILSAVQDSGSMPALYNSANIKSHRKSKSTGHIQENDARPDIVRTFVNCRNAEYTDHAFRATAMTSPTDLTASTTATPASRLRTLSEVLSKKLSQSSSTLPMWQKKSPGNVECNGGSVCSLRDFYLQKVQCKSISWR